MEAGMADDSNNGSTVPLNVRVPVKIGEKLDEEINKSALVNKLLKAHYDGETELRHAAMDVYQSMLKMADQIEWLTQVMHKTFGIPLNPVHTQPISYESFSEEMKKAYALYKANPAITQPKLPTEASRDMAVAILQTKEQNLLAQLEDAFSELPFMHDGRFFWGKMVFGFGLCDRNYPTTLDYDPHIKFFPVIKVDTDGPGWSVKVGQQRPYFDLGEYFQNPFRMIHDDMETLVKVAPVIVADYLAYRKAEEGK
jgi:hypothetical protein